MGICRILAAQAGAIAACVSLALGAVAQQGDVPQQESSTGESSRGIEEITVTAEKTVRSLQDTAIAIQAFGVRDIERLGLSEAKDIAHFTPGMVALPGPGGAGTVTFTGRGVGDRDIPMGMSHPVGLYVDGIYIGSPSGANLSLLDIERIEVLKGPQGTLFGRNTIGGAVSITTVKPQAELGGSVKVGIGSFKARSLRAMFNVPLIRDTLFARASVLRNKRDPFWDNKNPTSGTDYEDQDEISARLAARWLATENLTVDWSFDRMVVDNDGVGAMLVKVNPAFGARVLAITGVDLNQYVRRDAGDINTNHPGRVRVNTWQNSVTLIWDAGENTTIKSISGWRRIRQSYGNDFDGTPLRLFSSGVNGSYERNFYQEIQATGNLFENRLDYAVGAIWFEEEADQEDYTGYQEAVLGGLGNSIRKYWHDSYAWGIYGQTTLHATNQLHLTAGLRYSKERKEMMRGNCGFRITGGSPVPPFFTWTSPDLDRPFGECVAGGGAYSDLNGAAPGVLDHRAFRSDNWSPLFRVAYDWTEELMTYLSWSRGYRSGGLNPRYTSNVASLEPYEDEIVSQWEAGIKSRWLEDRLQINGSAFYSEYTNQQVQILNDVGAIVRENAGGSRIRGWELEAVAVPVDGLTIRLSHGWTAADFTEWKECAPGSSAPCVAIDRARFYRVPMAPKRTYTGVVSYIFPESEIGTFEVSANFFRASRMGTQAEVSTWRNTSTNTYTVYGGRAELSDAFGITGLLLSLVGTNITDRSYIVYGVDIPNSWTLRRFNPRQLMFEVGYEF